MHVSYAHLICDRERANTKVETFSRVGQWKIRDFGLTSYNYRKSDPFKVGIWSWHLSIEKNHHLHIFLFPEDSRASKDQPPIAKFFLRIFSNDDIRNLSISPIQEKLLRTRDDFVWVVESTFTGCLTIDVEFLDLKISPTNGGEASSIWPGDGMIQSPATQSCLLQSLSRMRDEAILADVTINTAEGTQRAHQVLLAARSPVFQRMFLHDLKEKESSTIEINDMSQDSCVAFVSYFYGDLKQEDFWKHRLALLDAANKYDMADLKDFCEKSLLEDINTENVLERLEVAWLYQLNKLKEGCFTYLFRFAKVYDVADELTKFFGHAHDPQLKVELFQKLMSTWRPPA